MANELSIYQKISDPLKAVEAVGTAIARCGMFGVANEAQGQVLALTCLLENKSPVEVMRHYHLITTATGGTKLAKKAESMLADFMAAGGKWVWKSTTDIEAKAHVEYGDNKMDVSYTIEEAKRAFYGYRKNKNSGALELDPQSNWVKIPATMLRWRLVANTIRMIAPAISAGIYTPEEIQDTVTLTDYSVNPSPLFAKPEQSSAKSEQSPVESGQTPLEKAAEAVPSVANLVDAANAEPLWGVAELRALIAESPEIEESDVVGWLQARDWLKADEPLDNLPEHHLRYIRTGTAQNPAKFFEAVVKFKRAKAQERKDES